MNNRKPFTNKVWYRIGEEDRGFVFVVVDPRIYAVVRVSHRDAADVMQFIQRYSWKSPLDNNRLVLPVSCTSVVLRFESFDDE